MSTQPGDALTAAGNDGGNDPMATPAQGAGQQPPGGGAEGGVPPTIPPLEGESLLDDLDAEAKRDQPEEKKDDGNSAAAESTGVPINATAIFQRVVNRTFGPLGLSLASGRVQKRVAQVAHTRRAWWRTWTGAYGVYEAPSNFPRARICYTT